MRGEWRFGTAGEVIFGRGAVRRTGEAVQEMGARRALLITDPALAGAGLSAGCAISASISATVFGASLLSMSQPSLVTTTSSSMRMPMPHHFLATPLLPAGM